MTAFVLDASAVLAAIRDEPGAAIVAEGLPDAAVSAVNLSEIVSVLIRDGRSPERIRDLLDELRLDVRPFDEVQAVYAGELIAVTASAGLSLGDRACLALARSLAIPVLTADQSWRRLPPIASVDIRFIR